MLEKPDLEDEVLITQLRRSYGLHVVRVAFLALGADPNTAVYRAVTDDQSYFVKLRRGTFDEASVTLPHYLRGHGVEHIISPLQTKTELLWTTLDAFTVVLCPFVTGQSGYAVSLTEQNWHDFGAALRRLHTLRLPPPLLRRVRRETFEADGRTAVRRFLARLAHTTFADSIAAKTATFMKAKRAELLELVGHAERLAQTLQKRELELVVCHADLHAGNLLFGSNHHFYIVDWDDPILAPKERDLMFVGGAQGFAGCTPSEEERLFYRGYGQVPLDSTALAYYRFERIVQDVAVYCDELTQPGGDEDRRESLHYLMANFTPGGTVERAYAADTALSRK